MFRFGTENRPTLREPTTESRTPSRPMSSLKPITPGGIPSALKKVERYRLLNDAVAAESICLDVIEVDPGNQEALVSLVLSISDQLDTELTEGVARARQILPRITDEYERTYLAGIICE